MLKTILLTAVTAASLGVVTVAPANAFGNLPEPDPTPTAPVPEPLTVLGSLAVGGGILAKKIADSKQK